jgi:hypothetical protein
MKHAAGTRQVSDSAPPEANVGKRDEGAPWGENADARASTVPRDALPRDALPRDAVPRETAGAMSLLEFPWDRRAIPLHVAAAIADT